jgi:hypothetical protein
MKDDKSPPISKTTPAALPDSDSWKDISSVVDVREPVNVIARKRALISSQPPRRILPSTPPKAPTGSRIAGARLFIIDDDPVRVDALAMDLRNLSAVVSVGDRSQGGYSQAAKLLPDAIISDLVRPGDQGFSFIQNLRRHPLLRWSSVILIRWWQEVAEGEGQVSLEPVLDQLEEALAPTRIIKERIAAGRPVKERLEAMGPAALLRLLSHDKLTGELSINDTWNNFTVQMVHGSILSAYRKGIDGESDEDAQALLQLMLCDTGRWSFRRESIASKRETLDTRKFLEHSNRLLSNLFGPGKRQEDDLHQRIVLRGDFLRSAAAQLPNFPMTIPEAIAGGEGAHYFAKKLTNRREVLEAERILQTLFRSGAIRYLTPADASLKPTDNPAPASVAALLRVLRGMPFALESPKDAFSDRWEAAPKTEGKAPAEASADPLKGTYNRQNIEPEKLGKRKSPRAMRLVAARRHPGTDSTEDAVKDGSSATPGAIASGSAATAVPPGSPGSHDAPPVENTGTEKMLLESQRLMLGEIPKEMEISAKRESGHKWVAILLALLLGGLLIWGIYVIAVSGKETRAPASEVRDPP